MSEKRVSEWFDENAANLRARARNAGVKTAEDAEDLVQDVVVEVLEDIIEGRIKEGEKFEGYANGILQHFIADYFRRRYNEPRRASDPGELGAVPEKGPDEADIDTLVAQVDPVSVAAAMIDVATPARRKVVLSALLHWGASREMEQTLGLSRGSLRTTAYRLRDWLAKTFSNSFSSAEHQFSRIRPSLDLVIERYVRILNDHYSCLGVPDAGLDAAIHECRSVVSSCATELGANPQSVCLFVDLLRYVSPLRQDLSGGRISFILAEKREHHRFEDAAIQGAIDAIRDADDVTQDGDIAGTVRYLARAWRRAIAFEPRDLVEELAIRLLRRKILVGIVWRVANGGVGEDDLALLLS